MFRKTVKYFVTDAMATPHFFKPGTQVKFLQASTHGDRFLFRGKNEGDRHTIDQWLAAEDVETKDGK